MRNLMLGALLVACSAPAQPAVTTGPTPTTAPVTTALPTTTAPEQCGGVPYEVGTLPDRVSAAGPAEQVRVDEFTSVPGTSSDIWVDAEGAMAVALIRGTLPPVEWPGDRGEVSIDGARGVAGPFEDGKWVVAWFEDDGTDRCDRYTMVFYPPVEPAEVEATLASMDRTAG